MYDRESTQLLLLAGHYLHLAKTALQNIADGNVTAKEVAEKTQKYVADGTIDRENEVLGHLASAAIRLATIAEKYPKQKYPKLNLGENYRNCVKERQKKAICESKKMILGNLPEYIHFLFRDNAAHFEDDNREYADVRKEVIPGISVSAAYSAVEKLLEQIEAQLLSNGIVDKSDS